ncbi:glutathione peroxidase [Brevibacillus daliensis]|uniref:glutathione peroxidase n=1 Tax=Brevibacillus daliensis TaxID=2892995 RepID=UPI001E6390AE|nr:glutathione peroxidase [Brevibacillus daliensis]
MSIYDFSAQTTAGRDIPLDKYKGKVMLLVNTASKCGLTPQYSDLQKLYERYQEEGLEILGFPCNQFAEQEPGTSEEAVSFCQLNYGVTFRVFAKIDVRGLQAHPLYQYLIEEAPFQGFDQTNSSGRLLQAVLESKHPELLPGDGIKWNFTKFLVDRNGNVVQRFEPAVDPLDMEEAIKQLL